MQLVCLWRIISFTFTKIKKVAFKNKLQEEETEILLFLASKSINIKVLRHLKGFLEKSEGS